MLSINVLLLCCCCRIKRDYAQALSQKKGVQWPDFLMVQRLIEIVSDTMYAGTFHGLLTAYLCASTIRVCYSLSCPAFYIAQ